MTSVIGTRPTNPLLCRHPDIPLNLPFIEGSGSVVHDLSGNGNDGTVTDATWTSSEHGPCLSFNGTSAYVDCGTGSSLDITNAITMEMLIYVADDINPYLVDKGLSYRLRLDAGKIRVLMYIGGAVKSVYSPSGSIANDTLYHIVSTYDKNDGTNVMYLYLNGVDVSTSQSNTGGGAIDTTVDSLLIGRLSSGYYFGGTMSMFRIYNSALSATEIKRSYMDLRRRLRI
ncbi:MAG: LamG domain-containing protein [Halobacteriota archaeon]|nr:LamG domain-containing protein [Halobacteriota archaeon]